MDEPDERLFRSIVDGLLETPPWAGFVRELRSRFAGNYASVMFRRPDAERSIEIHDDLDLPTTNHREVYRERFIDKDPIRYYAMAPGVVSTIDEFLTDEDSRAFHEQFLKPAGMHHVMISYVAEPSGFRAWLTVTRGPDAPPFSPANRILLGQVARHFEAALRVFATLKRTEFDQDLHARTSRALHYGIIVLDQSHAVFSIDDDAQRKLGRQTELSVQNGRLRLHDRTRNRELQERIAQLARPEADPGRSVTMYAGGEARLELLLCAVKSPLDCASASMPRVAVYLSSRLENTVAEAGRVAELFHLTNREAALAVLLARGRMLSEAAGELNITEQTARTYSKRIFLKTGVRRQTELVSRILTSVVRIPANGTGPEPPSERSAG